MNELEKHFTASALVLNEDNKILLLYHKKLNVWLYPGGHVEKNETPDESIVREVFEETGLKVEIMGQKDNSLADYEADVTVLYNPYVILCELINGEPPHYHIDLIYKCKVTNFKDLKYNKAESKAIGFFDRHEIEKLPLFPNFKALLHKFFEEET